MIRAPHSLRPAAVAAVAALGAIAPQAGHAQSDDTPLPAFEPRAWVGILADVGAVAEGRFAILVRDVHVTGPAHRGGVVPGDRLVALNGSPIADFQHWLRAVAELEAGEPLTLTVVRGGATLDARIVADRRPGWVAAIDPAEMDSVQSRIWQRFDSIYERRALGRVDDSVFLTVSNPTLRLRATETRLQVSWERSGEASTTVRVVVGAGADSATELARRELATLREERSRRELAELNPTPALAGGGGGAGADPGNRPLPETLALRQGRGGVLLGGVLVRDLTDDLGRCCFGIAAGALVTDVLAGSPAPRIGFHAGDVIAGVAGQPVRSVLDLRIALAEATLPVRIAVVRRGEMIDLVYPPNN